MAYARLAPPLLDAMYPTISELTMREGQHLEAAHDYAGAFDTYLKALDGRYQGQQNRAFTLYRLGTLQREHGLGEGKPDFLMQAYEHPQCPVAAFEVVARQMLSAYGPDKEAPLKKLFTRWEATVAKPEEWAMYYFYRGGYAQMAGHPEEARAFWERGEGYVPGSPCAYSLAEALYAEGVYDKAENYNNKYLLEGQNPDYLASAQKLALKLAAPRP
jgi:tetratricopeptide (TPR) repeat protein